MNKNYLPLYISMKYVNSRLKCCLNTYLIYAKPTFFFPAWIWQLWLWVMSPLLYWYVSLYLETLKCACVRLIKIYGLYCAYCNRLQPNATAWLWLWVPGWGSQQCLQWLSTDTRIHPWYAQILTHHSPDPGLLILITVCCHKHLNYNLQSWQSGSIAEKLTVLTKVCFLSQSLAAGLTSSQPVEKLRALPLWLSLQYLGHDGIVERIKHASQLVSSSSAGIYDSSWEIFLVIVMCCRKLN